MSLNLNAGYGNLQASRITAKTGGKTFYVRWFVSYRPLQAGSRIY